MALTEAFFEAINSKDLKDIRIMMKDSFLVDPTFRLFDEMEKETKGIPELYVEHDGREIKMDKNLWDDEYMNLLMVQVVRNFSHERVDHLKEVVRYLRPVTEKTNSSETTNSAKKQGNEPNRNYRRQPEKLGYQEQKQRDINSGDYRGTTMAVGGAAIGGLGGGVIAYVAGAPVAIGVIGGLVAGGVIGVAIKGRCW